MTEPSPTALFQQSEGLSHRLSDLQDDVHHLRDIAKGQDALLTWLVYGQGMIMVALLVILYFLVR